MVSKSIVLFLQCASKLHLASSKKRRDCVFYLAAEFARGIKIIIYTRLGGLSLTIE